MEPFTRDGEVAKRIKDAINDVATGGEQFGMKDSERLATSTLAGTSSARSSKRGMNDDDFHDKTKQRKLTSCGYPI